MHFRKDATAQLLSRDPRSLFTTYNSVFCVSFHLFRLCFTLIPCSFVNVHDT